MTGRRTSLRLVGAAAAGLDVVALLSGIEGSWRGYAVALLLHLLAAACVRRAVRRRCGDRADATLAILGALAVPVFGALLTCTLRAPEGTTADGRARQVLEEYDRWVRFSEEPHRPTPFTGDAERDFVTYARVESHAVVLRSGTTAQKREVLRRLVDSERPELLRLVRHALGDEDPEVRLLAYGELQRLETRLYRDLDDARQWAHDAADDEAAQAAPIFAHRHLASSGVLDDAMSTWHAREAERLGRDLGSVLEAGARIGPGAAVEPVEPERLAAAAFRERSFVYVRAFGRALAADGRRVPGWIRALEAPSREAAA